jgi:hypothetical protein
MTTIPTGRFVWFDYVSNEARKVQEFFGQLFGWKTNDVPMPGGRAYTMIVASNGPIGGYTQPPPVGTHWLPYLQVADAEATAAQVASLGGKVTKAPYAVGDFATMALIVDPVGAAFALWQPNQVQDTGDYKGIAGTWIWNELYSTDPDKSVAFYKAIGGFQVETMKMGGSGAGPERYEILQSDGKGRAGIMKMPEVPPHWMPYVQVTNTDATVEKAKKLGADVKTVETVPGIGRLAVFIDPLGAPLGILQPQ